MLGPCIGFFEAAEAVYAFWKCEGRHDFLGGVDKAVVISGAGDVFADGFANRFFKIYERLIHWR